MSTISLVDKRKARASLCDFCGEPDHKTPLMCPRILKIKYGEDGEITVYFTDSPVIIKFGNADETDH